MTFNIDTIFVDAGRRSDRGAARVLGAPQADRTPEDHIPTKIQLFWETVVGEVNKPGRGRTSARLHPYVVPLAIALFFFILFCNWLEMIPTELNDDIAPAAVAHGGHQPHLRLALVAIVSVWVYGIRKKGAKGYFKHYLEPYP